MKFGQYGVFTFTDIMNGAQLTELCAQIEDLGYSTLWYPEAMNYETFAIGAYLLSQSKKLVVASGIANIYARDPAASAMGHNSLNSLYDGRFVLGLGVSHAPLVADVICGKSNSRRHDMGSRHRVANDRSLLRRADDTRRAGVARHSCHRIDDVRDVSGRRKRIQICGCK